MATQLSDIPTISSLYGSGNLFPAPDAVAAPNAAINAKISTVQSDITKLAVDAIVNAANKTLLGGGGVDGAIHKAAGPELLEDCRMQYGCDTGSAKITKGYKLPAAHVVHAVGPVYTTSKADAAAALLAGCYKTALELAADNGCKSIAFPAIATGVYCYPSEAAARKACETVRRFLEEDPRKDKIERVVFCNFMPVDVEAYDDAIPRFFPPTAEEAKGS